MKILLLIVILFFAVGIAMALLTRLTRIQQKIADLHKDLGSKDAELARHQIELERLSAAQDAQNQSQDDERKVNL
jgi:cytochrome b561